MASTSLLEGGEGDTEGHEIDEIDLPAQHYAGTRIRHADTPRKFYHLPQMLKADILLDRINYALENDTGRQLKDFKKFEFQIYTARMNTLQDQTLARLMNADSECFSENDYNLPKKNFKQKASKHVSTYSKKFNVRHEELKGKARDEPDTLFLIIADEAHWGISNSEQKEANINGKNAHEHFIACWGGLENVIVIEVSATPYSLLTTSSQIPMDRLLITHLNGTQFIGKEDGIKTYRNEKNGDRLPSNQTAMVQLLHILEWSVGLYEQFLDGLVATVQVPMGRNKIGWLCIKQEENKLCLAVCGNAIDLTEFYIESNPKTETISIFSEDETLRVGYSSTSDQLEVYPLDYWPKDMKHEFHCLSGFGEDVFILRTCGPNMKYLVHTEDGSLKLLNRGPEMDKILPSPPRKYAFMFYAFRKPEDSVYGQQYLSLNYIFNSMRNADPKKQLLRGDPRFSRIKNSLKGKIDPGTLLIAEYAFFILLLRELRALHCDKNLKPEVVFTRFRKERDRILNEFAESLNKYSTEKLKPISSTEFQTVLGHLSEDALESLCTEEEADEENFWLSFLPCVAFCKAEHWQNVMKIPAVKKFMLKVLPTSFDSFKCKFLAEDETFVLLDNLVQEDEQNQTEELNGHMKVIRARTTEEGKKMYLTICVARKVASRQIPLYFEVLRDFGEAKLCHDSSEYCDELMKGVLHRIMKHLQTDECQHKEKRTHKGCHQNCKKYNPRKDDTELSLECENCGHKHKVITQYSDLDRLPCILILVDKGRLGSTYPPSMNMMDLRLGLNEKPMYTTCVQELGRLCRYKQKTKEALTEPYALLGETIADRLQASLGPHAVFHGYFSQNNKIDQKVQKSDQGLKSTKDSYLFNNKNPNSNHFLLKAEPQIGKTGVFLRLIATMRKMIGNDHEDEYESESGSEAEHDDSKPEMEKKRVRDENDMAGKWLLPYWDDLEKFKLPMTVKHSKYARIYGEYKHGEVPQSLFKDSKIEAKTKKESEITKQCYDKLKEPAFPEAFTHFHACALCSKECDAKIEIVNKLGREFKVSIPASSRYAQVYDKLGIGQPYDEFSEAMQFSESMSSTNDHSRLDLKTWIFTPSYGRWKKANLNLYHTMHDEGGKATRYIHVVVVREEDFNAYCRYWSSSHVIIQLPVDLEGAENDVAAGAVGYARLFIQRLASEIGLQLVFMMDDNIPYIKQAKISLEDSRVERCGDRLVMERVLLFEVLKSMEKVMDEGIHENMVSRLPKNYKSYSFPNGTTRKRRLLRGVREYTGPQEKYAVVGIGKERPNSTAVTNAFRQRHVYSLSLVNIAALQENHIEYKPWPVFEDITLNIDAAKKDLYVTKMYRYAMRKRNLATWLPSVFMWDLKTQLCPSVSVKTRLQEVDLEDEERIILSWLKLNLSPKHVNVWPEKSQQKLETNKMWNLFNSLNSRKEKGKSSDQVVFISPNIEHNFFIQHIWAYFKQKTEARKCVKHAMIFPVAYCRKDQQKTATKLCSLAAMCNAIIKPAFGDSLDEKLVFTSHNVHKYHVALVVVFVQGRVIIDAGSNPLTGTAQPSSTQTQPPEGTQASQPASTQPLETQAPEPSVTRSPEHLTTQATLPVESRSPQPSTTPTPPFCLGSGSMSPQNIFAPSPPTSPPPKRKRLDDEDEISSISDTDSESLLSGTRAPCSLCGQNQNLSRHLEEQEIVLKEKDQVIKDQNAQILALKKANEELSRQVMSKANEVSEVHAGVSRDLPGSVHQLSVHAAGDHVPATTSTSRPDSSQNDARLKNMQIVNDRTGHTRELVPHSRLKKYEHIQYKDSGRPYDKTDMAELMRRNDIRTSQR